MWTLLALSFMIVLAGFIAYYGDLQGRRWGKRRVSWWGLRPKHTAILITSLTGSGIALMSTLTLMAVSPTVRRVVLTGEHALDENKRLNTQLSSLNIQLKREGNEYDAELKDKQANMEAATARYNLVCGQLTETKKQMREAQSRKAELQHVKGELEQTLNKERTEIARLLTEKRLVEDDNRRAATINSDLGKQNIRLMSDNLALEKAKQELGQTNTQLVAGNAQLQKEGDSLRALGEELRTENEARKKENLALKNDSQALYERNIQLQAKVEDLQSKQNEFVQQQGLISDELAGYTRNFTRSYQALRQGRITVRAGEALARATIADHERPEAVRRQLLALLDDASAVAELRGAVVGENGRAVRIIGKRIVTLAGAQETDETASLNALVDNLTAGDKPVVVVANAVDNSVVGESVLVELSSRPVNVVFTKGALVASQRIDAHQPVEHILDQIVQFLQKDVHDAAITAGIIPQIDPNTGALRLGNLGPTELILLTDRVHHMGGQVVLKAVAKEPTTTADSLLLDFQLARPRAGS